jgi:hypothetical protein
VTRILLITVAALTAVAVLLLYLRFEHDAARAS